MGETKAAIRLWFNCKISYRDSWYSDGEHFTHQDFSLYNPYAIVLIQKDFKNIAGNWSSSLF